MTLPAIALDAVVRRFGELTAVDQVSFEVRRGEIFGLLGHNGAGKTTLIRLINGLLRTDQGSITTLGWDPIRQGEEVRRRTGVLTEYPALDHFLSPTENLAVYAAIHGLDARDGAARAEALLRQLGLDAHRDVPSHSLSAGLKQRVALARALIHDPELLLLDEPTSNLDPIAARGVRDLVQQLARERGRTVLLSTHNLAEAQQLCDRIAIIRNGRLLAVGDLNDLGEEIRVGAVQIRVEPDDVTPAKAVLDDLGLAPSLAADLQTFDVRLQSDEVPRVVSALGATGIRIHAVVPETPTLEDVYVSLHADAAHTSAEPQVVRP
jgi:ABC-2 type transport system ATP-binding protein